MIRDVLARVLPEAMRSRIKNILRMPQVER